MTLVVAFDEVKKNRVRFAGYGADGRAGYTLTQFIGSSEIPGTLIAYLTEHEPGRVTRPHYHIVDEYQVVLTEGNFGRHKIRPNTVHFARAYTPYGPLSSSGGMFTFFTLRLQCDPGSKNLAKNKDVLKAIPNRRPWQISRAPGFPKIEPGSSEDFTLQPITDTKDEDGLAAYSLSIKPNGSASAPAPSQSAGQYVVVLTGSLWHDNKEHKAPTLAFIKPDEGAFPLQAGPDGLEAFVLNFPRSNVAA